MAQIDEWALRGVHFAEEQAHKAAKQLGANVDPANKLVLATDFVLSFVEKQGWHNWTRDRVTKLVEAKLNVVRSGPTLVGNPSTTLAPAL